MTFTGKTSLRITGRYVVVQGLIFEDCELRSLIVSFVQAKRCRVTGCRFLNSNRGSGRAVFTFGDGADDNRVDHCRLINTVGRSVQIIIGGYAEKHGPPLRNRIDHNLFHATDEATVPTPGQSAVFADPKFVDATAGDYRRREGDGPRLGASGESLQAGP